MTTILLASVLLGVAVVIALLAAMLVRRPVGHGEVTLIQQQLVELRERVERLATSQQEVPKALADGALGQARALADVRERLGQLGEATKRLQSVGEQVSEVHQLLQIPKLRGNLGEVMLEQLLAEVLPPAQYVAQHALSTGRVDAVIKIGGRLIPVDAKFPMESCRRMLEAPPEEVDRERRGFLKSVRDRIDEVASKYIRPAENTYEFALMYIPAETVYYEAVVREASLDDAKGILRYALERCVVPVSPHTFYAYLLVILHGLRGMKLDERARHIQGELGTLTQEFERFWDVIRKVGGHLANAQRQYAEGERQAGVVRARLDRIADVGLAPEADPPRVASETEGPALLGGPGATA